MQVVGADSVLCEDQDDEPIRVVHSRFAGVAHVDEMLARTLELPTGVEVARWQKSVSYTHLTLPTKRIV